MFSHTKICSIQYIYHSLIMISTYNWQFLASILYAFFPYQRKSKWSSTHHSSITTNMGLVENWKVCFKKFHPLFKLRSQKSIRLVAYCPNWLFVKTNLVWKVCFKKFRPLFKLRSLQSIRLVSYCPNWLFAKTNLVWTTKCS